MIKCGRCHYENPDGSKFCAGCGAALPSAPVSARCPACGADNPGGSRFCKACGQPLPGAAAVAPPKTAAPTSPPVTTAPARAKPREQKVQQLKTILWIGAGLYVLAAFLILLQVSAIQSAYGAYARFMANTDLQWFLLVLNLALAGLNFYVASRLQTGALKPAKGAFLAMIIAGAILLLLALGGGILFVLVYAAILVGGVRGWMRVSREEKGL